MLHTVSVRSSHAVQLVSKSPYCGFCPKLCVTNFFRHLEHPKVALKLEKPHAFRVAGMQTIVALSPRRDGSW